MQTFSCPKAALFDLDDTLTPGFETPSPPMIRKVLALLERIPVAIITGRDFSWMKRDFLSALTGSSHLDRFFLFPESSAQCLQYVSGSWVQLYSEGLTEEERAAIETAVTAAVEESGLLSGLPVFGARFLHKECIVSFAALGIDVPRDAKRGWDPGNMKRSALRDAAAKRLPQYEVAMGGSTTIDIMKQGVDKAFGVRWLADRLRVSIEEMFYVGDAFFEGGNDKAVIPTGIRTRVTSGPSETSQIIDELITACSA